MARKPPPSLPDVFAKPGAAPSRGTAIEDLPLVIDDSSPLEPPQVVTAPKPLPMPAKPVPVARAPEPPPAAPEPPPVMTVPGPFVAPEAVPPSPPPATQESDHAPAEPGTAPSPTTRGMALAVVALAVALTVPFWEEPVLSALGIRTPVGRAAEQSTLAVLRQERRTEEIAQRLTAATALIAKQQAEFAAAVQRADAAAVLVRTLSLVRLNETLRRPMPFAAELAMARVSGNDLDEFKPLLDQIDRYADTGIPGVAQLRQEFRTLLEQVAPTSPATIPSWIARLAVWVHLRSPTPIQADGDTSLDYLQLASARLADVDIAGAVQQAQRVGDPYRPAFSSWIEDAQARVAADSLAERISDMVTGSLAPAGGR